MRLSRAVRALASAAAVAAAVPLLLPGGPAAVAAEREPRPASALLGAQALSDRPTTAEIAAAVAALDREVTRVSDELARSAAAYEAAQDRLARATQGQFAARDTADVRRADERASQSAFDVLARAAYKGGLPPMITAVLSGDPRTVGDLVHVRSVVGGVAAARREHVLGTRDRGTEAELALARSDVDRRKALALRQLVEQRLHGLHADAERLTADLARTAALLEQARAADRARQEARVRAERQAAAERAARQRAAAAAAAGAAAAAWAAGPVGSATGPAGTGGTGFGCQPPGPYGEANGFLSDEGLCGLAVGGGHRLRTDAARAFDRLSAAHRAETGAPLCVTDSYRSYAAQVDVFRRKPGLAATPGRSQHGWGLAVDLCGGVQTFGHPEHEWMRSHAPAHGWVHPAWAQQTGSKPEAWHWEYVGS